MSKKKTRYFEEVKPQVSSKEEKPEIDRIPRSNIMFVDPSEKEVKFKTPPGVRSVLRPKRKSKSKESATIKKKKVKFQK